MLEEFGATNLSKIFDKKSDFKESYPSLSGKSSNTCLFENSTILTLSVFNGGMELLSSKSGAAAFAISPYIFRMSVSSMNALSFPRLMANIFFLFVEYKLSSEKSIKASFNVSIAVLLGEQLAVASL